MANEPLTDAPPKAVASAPERPERSDRQRRAAFLIISGGMVMATLDLSIVNVAMPSIARGFHSANLAGLSWVLNAYVIVYAALMVPAGRLADRASRRTYFLAGTAIFTAGSVLCAASVDVPMLVAARVLQAVGAATLMPTSLSLVLADREPADRPKAVRAWVTVAGVAAALGPSTGGLLVNADWRWTFLVNLPIGLAIMGFGPRILPDVRNNVRGPLPDIFGALLLATGVGLLALGLVEGNDWGWGSPRILGCFAAFAAATVWVVARSRTHPSPQISVALLKLRGFTLANVAGLFYTAAFGAMLLSVSLWAQDVFKWSPLKTGLALTPGDILLPFMTIPGGWLVKKAGLVKTVVLGCLIMALGALWWALNVTPSSSYLAGLFPGIILTRIGLGISLPAVVGVATKDLPAADLATGAAINNMVRQIGYVVGYSVFVLIASQGSGTSVETAFHRGWIFSAVTVALGAAAAGLLLVQRKAPAEVPVPA